MTGPEIGPAEEVLGEKDFIIRYPALRRVIQLLTCEKEGKKITRGRMKITHTPAIPLITFMRAIDSGYFRRKTANTE